MSFDGKMVKSRIRIPWVGLLDLMDHQQLIIENKSFLHYLPSNYHLIFICFIIQLCLIFHSNFRQASIGTWFKSCVILFFINHYLISNYHSSSKHRTSDYIAYSRYPNHHHHHDLNEFEDSYYHLNYSFIIINIAQLVHNSIRSVYSIIVAKLQFHQLRMNPDQFIKDKIQTTNASSPNISLRLPNLLQSFTTDPPTDAGLRSKAHSSPSSGGTTLLFSDHLIRALYNTPSNSGLSYQSFKSTLYEHVFGFSKFASNDFETLKELENQLHTSLKNSITLEELTSRYLINLEKALNQTQVNQPIGLFSTIYNLVYISSSISFFGRKFNSKKALNHLKVFNDGLGTLLNLISIPHSIFLPSGILSRLFARKTIKARNELRDLFVDWLILKDRENRNENEKDQFDEACGIVEDLVRIMNRAGWSIQDTATSMMVAFFVLQANAADGAGWSVLHLIQSPKTLNLIREEMKIKIKDHQISRWNSNLLSPTNIPFSNSTIDETLRLTTSVFSMRIVESKNTTVKLTQDFEVKNGTRLITVNRASSLDINIWGPKDPRIWIPTRLNHLNRKSLLHFGSGQTKCAGMKFAQIELVSILLGFLNRFDCQLLSKNGIQILIDDLDDQIIGFSPGFLPPTVGLGVVMKPREEVWVNLRLRNLEN